LRDLGLIATPRFELSAGKVTALRFSNALLGRQPKREESK